MSIDNTTPPDNDHPCRAGEDWDHDWDWVVETEGADDVINGVRQNCFWRCSNCGAIDTRSGPPEDEDYHD